MREMLENLGFAHGVGLGVGLGETSIYIYIYNGWMMRRRRQDEAPPHGNEQHTVVKVPRGGEGGNVQDRRHCLGRFRMALMKVLLQCQQENCK